MDSKWTDEALKELRGEWDRLKGLAEESRRKDGMFSKNYWFRHGMVTVLEELAPRLEAVEREWEAFRKEEV